MCILVVMYVDVQCIGLRAEGASAFAKASGDKTPSSRLGGSLALQGKDGRHEWPGQAPSEGYGSLRKATEG